MAKLDSNENFPLAVVQEPRRLGHDVVTIQERGKAEQRVPDDAVLQFALAEDRAVLTLNRKHFFRLHQQHPAHAGRIACTVDGDFLGQANRIHEAIVAAGELHGQLIRVNRPST